EGGLVIESLDVAIPAGEEDPDHRLRPRSEMRRAQPRASRARGVNPGSLRPRHAVTMQHGPESQPGEAHAKISEKSPPINPATGTGRRMHGNLANSIATKNTKTQNKVNSNACHHSYLSIVMPFSQFSLCAFLCFSWPFLQRIVMKSWWLNSTR